MKLYELCQDKGLMNELKEYFSNVLREKAIEKVFTGQATQAVKEAKEIIEAAFENIDLQFQPKVDLKDRLNEAR